MRPLVMGVLNVTPDSFYDGGRWFDHDKAIAQGRALAAEGADVVDVGGESTRPGAHPVGEEEELRRVLPVIKALASVVRVSVDTRKAAVAEAAIDAGATLLNDVSASLYTVASATGAGWIAVHMAGEPATMQVNPSYEDVVGQVRDFLAFRARQALDAGVREVWVDPGIGFGKTAHHNLCLLGHLAELVATGFPVLVGTSRKGFLGRFAEGSDPRDRLEASLATATWAMAEGARMVRVHDVAPTLQAARIVAERLDDQGDDVLKGT